MLRRTVAATLGLLVALAAAAEAKKKPLEGIALEWRPTDELGEYSPVDLTGLAGVKVEVRPFTDGREDKALIAENREDADEGKILKVTTSDDVGAWLADRTAWVMDQFGVETVEEGGTVVVSGEVKRFFVTETHVYESDVGIKLEVKDRSGKLLWAGVVGGSATRFGRSYKAENYYEVLSDATIEAVHDALTNGEFSAALSGQGGG